jgi:hypothetical protein
VKIGGRRLGQDGVGILLDIDDDSEKVTRHQRSWQPSAVGSGT